MSNSSYTILTSTNPELISSGSTFVKESKSELLKIENNRSHFLTRGGTMDEQLTNLSLKYSAETFNAECHWDNNYCYRIIYSFEYKNGKCKELGIEPGYLFIGPIKKYKKKHFKEFQKHVIKHLSRLDIVYKEKGEFGIDTLGDIKDKYGYKSSVTITYENDNYVWTAKRICLTWIEVSVKKKKIIEDSFKEHENKTKSTNNTDYDDLPF